MKIDVLFKINLSSMSKYFYNNRKNKKRKKKKDFYSFPTYIYKTWIR